MTTIYHDIEVDDVRLLDVEFSGSVNRVDDEYEDNQLVSQGYLYCDDIVWNKDVYTFQDNSVIDAWLYRNYNKIEQKLIDKHIDNE